MDNSSTNNAANEIANGSSGVGVPSSQGPSNPPTSVSASEAVGISTRNAPSMPSSSSSSQGTTSFIGTKISLISRSEIRYEGLLYTINPETSTVALANVRSFGTEDRLTDQPVAASDDNEFMIFKPCDIKELTICETHSLRRKRHLVDRFSPGLSGLQSLLSGLQSLPFKQMGEQQHLVQHNLQMVAAKANFSVTFVMMSRLMPLNQCAATIFCVLIAS